MLADAGIAREFGETREDFARRAARAAPCFAALTEMHLAGRFRSPTLPIVDRPELQVGRWRPLLRVLRRELGRAGSPLRRWLGFVNPASFLDSR
jgi:hypothetical protein